jgi:hypothetical protein
MAILIAGLAVSSAAAADASAASPAPPAPPASLPSVPVVSGGGVHPDGGYGWQYITADSLTLRDEPGGSPVAEVYYGDLFYTDDISGSWCYGPAYDASGDYIATGWGLCQYMKQL